MGIIEWEREVSMRIRYVLLSICDSYFGVGIGLYFVGIKKDIYFCLCMKVLYSMYLYVIEYSMVWVYM